MTSESWWHEGFTLISLLEVTSWTTIIQQKIPYATQKHVRDPHYKISEDQQSRVNKRGRKGVVQRLGAREHSLELTAVPGKGGIETAGALSVAPANLTE